MFNIIPQKLRRFIELFALINVLKLYKTRYYIKLTMNRVLYCKFLESCTF